MRTTKPCTPVYFYKPDDMETVKFEIRRFREVVQMEPVPFTSDPELHIDHVEDMLLEKQRQFQELKEARRTKAPALPRQRTTWKQKVDAKRMLVASYLASQPTVNLSDACRFAGCSFQLAKRVQQDVQFYGEPSLFHAQNQKNEADIEELNQSINTVEGSCTTVADLKRRHPSFSRKWIAKQLKRTGHRWRLMTKRLKCDRRVRYSKRSVLEVVSHLAQALINPQVDTYYVDESHYPICQTATSHWTRTRAGDDSMVYNRRPGFGDEVKLTVISMCNLTSFVAVQVFNSDVTANDFLYFMQEALLAVPTRSKVTVLADNATWHTALCNRDTKATSFIHFNSPGLFQSNAIENCFSFVRNDFRKRPMVQTLEEEARLLLDIFYDPLNLRRFEGIARNHIRSLLNLLYYNYMAIATGNMSESSSSGSDEEDLHNN